jgi:hypothetical protein
VTVMEPAHLEPGDAELREAVEDPLLDGEAEAREAIGAEKLRDAGLEPGERVPLGDGEFGVEPPDGRGPGARRDDEAIGRVGAPLGLDANSADPRRLEERRHVRDDVVEDERERRHRAHRLALREGRAGLLEVDAADVLFGLWWLDPVAALVIAAVAVKEGRESWRGEGCCSSC